MCVFKLGFAVFFVILSAHKRQSIFKSDSCRSVYSKSILKTIFKRRPCNLKFYQFPYLSADSQGHLKLRLNCFKSKLFSDRIVTPNTCFVTPNTCLLICWHIIFCLYKVYKVYIHYSQPTGVKTSLKWKQ